MVRPRHPIKEVEEAIVEAERLGWICRPLGHWGRLFCPKADREGCQLGIYGTPKSGESHARQIRRGVLRCPHRD